MAPKHNKSKKKRKSSNNNHDASTTTMTMTTTPTSSVVPTNDNPSAEVPKTKKQRVIESTTTATLSSSSSSSITYETATSMKTIMSSNNDKNGVALSATLSPLFTDVLVKISNKNKSPKCEYNNKPQPTPIQHHTWPLLVLNNKSSQKNHDNLIAISPTGSGKTLAYVLPMVHYCLEQQRVQKMSKPSSSSSVRDGRGRGALVLLPTRELALQVHKTISLVLKTSRKKKCHRINNINMSKPSSDMLLPVIRNLVIHGGGGDDSHHLLQSSKDLTTPPLLIISATPGKLLPLCQSILTTTYGFMPSFWVLDEADRLLLTNGDLKDQVLDIWNQLTKRCQPTTTTTSLNDDDDDDDVTMERPTVCLFSASFIGRDDNDAGGNDAVDKFASKPRYVVRLDVMDRNNNKERGDSMTTESMMSRSNDTQTTKSPTSTTTSTNNNTDDSNNKQRSAGNQKPPRDITSLTKIPHHIRQILHVCSQHKKPRKLLTTLGHIRRDQQETNDEAGAAGAGAGAAGSGRRQRKRGRVGLLMVFFKTIKVLRYVAKTLKQEGIKAMELHGQMPQSQREKTLHDFRAGKVSTLLTTDIAARGIHVANVTHVINYDFPTLEQYVHRCGRAGRRHQNNNNNNNEDNNNNNNVTTAATVYSFFHRELKPMAKDILTLLRSGPPNTFIDPNLIALVDDKDNNDDDNDNNNDEGGEGGGKQKRRRRRRKQRRGNELEDNGNNDDGNDKSGDWKKGVMENGIENDSNDDDDDDDDNKGDRHVQKTHLGDSSTTKYNNDDDDDDDNEFQSLNKKIVFRRATHVSDASSDENDE